MRGLGSGTYGEFTFLDILSIMSFSIAMMNYGENLTQSDKQELQESLSQKAEIMLNEIHNHLQKQDEKIDKILEVIQSNDHR